MRDRNPGCRSAVTCFLSLTLSGCIAYTPAPLDPLVERDVLRCRARDVVTAPAAERANTNAAWFPLARDIQLADGLTLSEAGTLALFYSPKLAAKRRELNIAGAQVIQAGLLPNPEVYVGPRISTADSSLILPATLSWKVPFLGELGAERAHAESMAEDARWRVMDAELETLFEVRRLFLRVATLQEQRRILAGVQSMSQKTMEWVERLHGAGEVDAVTLYLARTEREEVAFSAEAKSLALENASNALLALVGLLPEAAVAPVLRPSPFALPELPAVDSDRLLRHPKLQAARALFEAADNALWLEIVKQYPRFSVGPDFESDDGEAQIGVGVGVILPLFDRNRGGIREAEERRHAAREMYREILLALSHEEAAARAKAKSAERLLDAYQKGTGGTAREMERALDARLRSGHSSVIEVLAARAAIAKARIRELDLREASLGARLRAAVTGGWVVEKHPIPVKPEKTTEDE